MGQYGFLLRTNLENLNLFEIHGEIANQRNKNEWKIRIDGIEGYPGYLTPVHDYSYNKIFIGDALSLLTSISNESYDFVLAVDILEHFTKEDGVRFLKECLRIASKSVLISTPKGKNWFFKEWARFLPDPLSIIAVSDAS